MCVYIYIYIYIYLFIYLYLCVCVCVCVCVREREREKKRERSNLYLLLLSLRAHSFTATLFTKLITQILFLFYLTPPPKKNHAEILCLTVNWLFGFVSLWRLLQRTVTMQSGVAKFVRVIMDTWEKHTETDVLQYVLCQQSSVSGCSNDTTSLNFRFLDIV